MKYTFAGLPPQYPDEGCQHHPVGAGSVVRCLIDQQVRSLHCFTKNITSHTAVRVGQFGLPFVKYPQSDADACYNLESNSELV